MKNIEKLTEREGTRNKMNGSNVILYDADIYSINVDNGI